MKKPGEPPLKQLAAVLLACLAVLGGCARKSTPPAEPQATAPAKPVAAQVNEVADAYVAAYFKRFPEEATFNRIAGARHDRMTDNTPAGRQAWQAAEDKFLADLDAIDPAPAQGTPEWLTYGILREALEASRGARICRAEEWHVDQVWGWQISLGELALAQPVQTADEREQALARWHGVPAYIDNEVENLRIGLAAGFSVPKHNVDLVVAQLDGLLAMKPDDSPWFAPAHDADDATRQQWRTVIAEEIYPAVRRYREYLAGDYRTGARDTIAIAAHPDGAACYASLLRYFTTLPYTGKEMFGAGEEAVALRETRMVEIGKTLFGTDDLGAIRKRLREDQTNRFKQREEILSYTEAAIARARAAAPQWFGRMPAADVIIRPIPEFQEQGSTARYVQASDDGQLPGTYYVNLFQPETQNRGKTESVAFHETYPGHHLQISLARERGDAHPVTRYVANSGFVEGWARYTETLADEMGLYSSKLNVLYMLSGLPTGMVVDPGIHAMGWTRDQAIAYTLSKQVNMTPEEAASYVDRIVVWPGQMTSYGAGELEILRLRRAEEQRLGPSFDVKAFHDRVLGNGSVTPGMLRAQFAH